MAQRKKTLIFHIGDCKTGSTSIQTAFAQKRVHLKNTSLCYPAKLAMNGLARDFTAYRKAETTAAKARAEEAIAAFASRLRRADDDVLLVSAELFEWVPVPLFQKLYKRHFADIAEELRVIAYVRPHAARILSSYAERTKIGVKPVMNGSLSDFAQQVYNAQTFTYLPRFNAWRQAFGPTFRLRPLIRSELVQGSVVEDFLQHAFPDQSARLEGSDAANESLCLEDLMRLKVVQRHLDVSTQVHHTMGWELMQQIAALPRPPHATKLRLHRSLAEEIRHNYLSDARALDAQFFAGTPLMERELDQAVETAIDSPQSLEPKDHLGTEELRSLRLLARVINGLLQEESVNWPRALHERRVRDIRAAAPATANAAE